MADLSPAAQSVLDATKVRFYEDQPSGAQLAAWILLALADHHPSPITLGQPIDHWHPDERTRQELRNIAEELGDCA
jgi:hypothetical protein